MPDELNKPDYSVENAHDQMRETLDGYSFYSCELALCSEQGRLAVAIDPRRPELTAEILTYLSAASGGDEPHMVYQVVPSVGCGRNALARPFPDPLSAAQYLMRIKREAEED